jgi:hypothetical protein
VFANVPCVIFLHRKLARAMAFLGWKYWAVVILALLGICIWLSYH